MSPKPEPSTGHQAVSSPCVDVCRMDPRTGWCEGCRRTIDEIAQWASLDDDMKRAVWENLAQRRLPPVRPSKGEK